MSTDESKANKLLDEAGYPRKADGMRFSVSIDWYPGEPDSMDTLAEYLKPQLKKIGIDVKLNPPADFLSWYKRIAGWQHGQPAKAQQLQVSVPAGACC